MVRRRFEHAPLGDLSLTAKGILVVSIPVCALLLAMAVFFQLQRQNKAAHQWVEHSFEVQTAIRRVWIQLIDAQTGTRGYLLTHQNPFLQPYVTAQQELPQRLDLLGKLIVDNAAQLDRFSRLKSRIAGVQETWAQERRDDAAGQAAALSGELESARRQMDDLRQAFTAMQDEERRLLDLRRAAQRKAQERLEAFAYAGGVLGLLGGVVAALLFSTSVVRRVQQLEENARNLAQGIPVETGVGGRDEIARLGSTLQDASRLLTARDQELRAAQSDLESRVRERTGELEAANQELHRSNAIRQAVISSSPLAIWAVDLEGNVTAWNPAAVRTFGWSEAEVIGKPLPVIPQTLQPEYQVWLHRFQLGESMVAVERARQKKDGTKIEVSIWTAPLRDSSGRIIGTIAIDNDITERKSLEEQFRQSQKLEAVGRLAGGIAHDFNNLLTVILGYAEMIVTEAGDWPSIQESAHEVQYAAERASALTAQLLAFSRRQISQPKVIDLNAVVRNSAKMLARVIGEDIEIVMHLDAALGTARLDPLQIDQLLMNLVVNARDAMPKGGRLTIETANVMLDEHYVGRHIGVAPGAYCMLAVSDDGSGMIPEVKSRLFEPFFTTKEAGRGTGLGLSIVYGIVKQNSGEIMVYSEPGQGTTFKVYFPLSEVPAEISVAESAGAALRGHETILLCEDEGGIRKLVRSMLMKSGYRVLEAESPHRAIEIARESSEPIHLLLTDVVMPHMSGFELARELARLRPEMKVLYTSGYTDNRLSGSWVLEPGAPFLHKPFTAGSLGQKVREALGDGQTAR
jgi:PAS domain S-box-containing protein